MELKEHFGQLDVDMVTVETTGSGLVVPTGGETFKIVRPVAAFWALRGRDRNDKMRLQSGDVLTVFNTIAAGPQLWSGTLDLQNAHKLDLGEGHHMNVYDMQPGVDAMSWAKMFSESKPAILVTGTGETVYGNLTLFLESGMDGAMWALSAYENGDIMPHFLQTGDHLTVYDHVTDGKTAFRQTLFLKPGRSHIDYGASIVAPISSVPNTKNQDEFTEAFRKHLPARVARIA